MVLYSTFTECTKAITDYLDNLPEYEGELKSLLSINFKTLMEIIVRKNQILITIKKFLK